MTSHDKRGDSTASHAVGVDVMHRRVLAECRRRVDPGYRSRIIRLIGDTEGVLGVPVPALREIAGSLHALWNERPIDDMLALMNRLAEDRLRESMLIGRFLLARRRRQLSEDCWPHVDRWVESIDNWETCDQLSKNVAAQIVAKHPRRVDELVRWARSGNAWRRRFAAAATTALNQGGRSDPQAALRVCEQLIGDGDPMVQKALAWAVREVSRKSQAEAFEFLRAHDAKLPPRVLREAAEKLSTAHRKRLGIARTR